MRTKAFRVFILSCLNGDVNYNACLDNTRILCQGKVNTSSRSRDALDALDTA